MTDSIIVDTATRILSDLCEPQTINAAEEGTWPQALWEALEESGLPLTWVPDTLGGAGAEMSDGFAVLRVAGRFAAPVPQRSARSGASIAAGDRNEVRMRARNEARNSHGVLSENALKPRSTARSSANVSRGSEAGAETEGSG